MALAFFDMVRLRRKDITRRNSRSGSIECIPQAKSFVSVAIGMLQDEGKITIQDKIASYFPEKLPEYLHPYIADASIRDLLMMSTPFQDSTYTVSLNPENDWIRSFFECEPSHRAGQIFSYDTSATTVLTALVEKLSGMELLDYLRSKGFDEMGFSREAICVKTPDGKDFLGWFRDSLHVAGSE